VSDKKQKVIKSGIKLVSNVGTKVAEELVVSFLGEGSRFFISPAGFIVNDAITSVLEDFTNRTLSHTEVSKIKTVVEATILEINSRLDGGATPRDDGFFTDEQTGRTKAEEIFEGVLLKARDQHEEKKLVHFGYFYSNLAFRSDIPPSLANYFIKTANALSYRQFVLLRHIESLGNIAFSSDSVRGRRHSNPDLKALAREQMELHSEFGGYGLLDAVAPQHDIVSNLGQTFVELFNLVLIPAEDMLEIRRLISLCEESPLITDSEAPY
jgi:hypothetical protein